MSADLLHHLCIILFLAVFLCFSGEVDFNVLLL